MKAELLAPAGSWEALEGAVGAGADAIYLGGPSFGARAYAKNFTMEELYRAVDYVHVHGRKLYLTVNTLFKERELEEQLVPYLEGLYTRGLDAVIVQDMGVLELVKRNFPDMDIHASTQMTITGSKGAAIIREAGASRVVPARELSLEELSALHREVPELEIESFIHGALCYCYSGQCLFSSILGGRSGNRGRCAQPCRLAYQVYRKGRRLSPEEGFCPLSLKDLCTVDLLPQILQAGVYSLKIEGRMKQPEYVAGVTGIYRKYLDLCLENRREYQVEEEDRAALAALFSRGGFTKGYYLSRNGRTMMDFGNAKKIGSLKPEIRKKKENLKGILMLFPESPAILELVCGKVRVSVEGDVVQEARNQPMTEEQVRRQMVKCADAPFQFQSLEVQMWDNIFCPIKSLNQLRRAGLEALEEKMLAPYRRGGASLSQRNPEEAAHSRAVGTDYRALDKSDHKDTARITGKTAPAAHKTPAFYASCETEGQARALMELPGIHGIYLELPMADRFLEQWKETDKELYVSLPHVVREGDLEPFREKLLGWAESGIQGYLVRNMESYGYLKELGLAEYCVLDSSLYTWNSRAQEFWQTRSVKRLGAPLELNGRELSALGNGDSEFLVYGYLPMMVSAQCVLKNVGSCTKKREIIQLKDRYQKEFCVKCYCDFCYNVVYNSIPYGLITPGEVQAVKNLGFGALRLAFTVESPDEAEGIAGDFLKAYEYEDFSASYTFTKGHFKRGVE